MNITKFYPKFKNKTQVIRKTKFINKYIFYAKYTKNT